MGLSCCRKIVVQFLLSIPLNAERIPGYFGYELTGTLLNAVRRGGVLEVFSGKVGSDIGSREVHIMGDLK